MTVYQWVLFDEHKMIVGKGVLDSCVDVDVEHIFQTDTCADRCLQDMQKYADEYLPDKKYRFFYQELEFDMTDFINEVLE